MKRIIFFAALMMISTGAFAFEPTKVVVVDMQKLLDNSTAATDIKDQAKKERDLYQASISKEEDGLRKEEAKLTEQRGILTQEAFSEKSRQFKDKVSKVQRDFQEKRAAHETTLKKALDQVNAVIFEIIDNLAQEEGFELAVPTSQILYATKKLDITDKVLERLNQKLPKLTLKNDEGKSDDSESKPSKKSAKKK